MWIAIKCGLPLILNVLNILINEFVYIFSIIFGHWDAIVHWKTSSWKTRTNLSYMINSLVPGVFVYSLNLVNFKLISMINISSIFCEIAIRWMPQHVTDHESRLVQVMVWCRQATSHYLSQCWHRSLSPYDVTRPQWVKNMATDDLVMQGSKGPVWI